MALKIADRVKESTSTTGIGTWTLAGAVSGFQAFGSVLTDGDTAYYGAVQGTDWEIGLGTYTSSGNTLARTTILASSNSGNAVDFTSAPIVWIDLPASLITQFQDINDSIAVDTATGNIGIGGPANASRILQVGTGTPTTAPYGMQFGSDTATNLYRSNTGVLKTDGFIYGGTGIAGVTMQANTIEVLSNNVDLVIETRPSISNTNIIFKSKGSTPTETMRCNSTGNLVLSGLVVQATYTVATLPAAVAGGRAFVSDSNATLAAGLGNTVVGSGSNFVPVYSDGTNWIIG